MGVNLSQPILNNNIYLKKLRYMKGDIFEDKNCY